MEKTLIVGFGSPYGFDQFGWLVIDALEKQLFCSESVVLYQSKGNGVDWLPEANKVKNIVIIDAVKSDNPKKYFHDFLFEENYNFSLSSNTSSHSINILESVALGKGLGMLTGTVRFMGVEFDSVSEEKESVLLETAILAMVEKLTNVFQENVVLGN